MAEEERCAAHSLSRQSLTEHLRILVDEEVLDRVLIAEAGCGLRKRPASGLGHS